MLLSAAALTCIYFGYRLFCGLPALNRTTQAGVFIVNVIPGALLALVGVGLLTTQVRAVLPHTQPTRRVQPSGETTRHVGKSGFLPRAA